MQIKGKKLVLETFGVWTLAAKRASLRRHAMQPICLSYHGQNWGCTLAAVQSERGRHSNIRLRSIRLHNHLLSIGTPEEIQSHKSWVHRHQQGQKESLERNLRIKSNEQLVCSCAKLRQKERYVRVKINWNPSQICI